MATQRNFEIKNGLNVAGTERIASNGDITGSHFGSFSGTTVTRSAGTNNTQLASTAYVDVAITNLIDSSPGTLNTLNELAAALGDDANFSTTVTNSIATKLPLAGGTLTGDLNLQADGLEIFLKSADYNIARIIPRGSSGSNLDKGLISLFDAGTEDIRIDTGGNSWIDTGNDLGIGTTTPGYKLEVNGTAHVVNTLTAGAIGIPSQGITLNQAFGTGVPSITMTGTANNGRGGAINFKESDGSGGAIANTAAIYSTDGAGGNANYGGLTIAAYQSDIRFSTGSLAGTKMIVQAAGNVGIGTANPTSYDTNSAGVSADLVVANTGHAGIVVASGSSSDAGIFFGDGSGAAAYKGAISYVNSQDRLYMKANGVNKATLDTDRFTLLCPQLVTPNFWIGSVPSTSNNNSGAVLLVNLTTANANNVGFQFSGSIIGNSYTGQAFVNVNIVKNYSNDAVAFDVADDQNLNSVVTRMQLNLCTITYSGTSYLAIVKNGGGTGTISLNGYFQGWDSSAIQEVSSGNYSITTNHGNLNF